MRGLVGKVALVTGAANRIGRGSRCGSPRKVARSGSSISTRRAIQCAGEIQTQEWAPNVNRRHRRHGAVERAGDLSRERARAVDILVNNAGWDRVRQLLDTRAAVLGPVIRINLYGPLNMHHVVLRAWRSARAAAS